MALRIIVSADDFGLSRHATDMILEAADAGALTNVSILANGEAFEYALEEYAKRAGKLSLTVHLNLTEGKALSRPEDVPHLTDASNAFRSSVGGLWLRYLCASPKHRQRMREEIAREIDSQIAAVRAKAEDVPLSIDGHQHVHMLPFVFDALISRGIMRIRIPREPLYVAHPRAMLRFLWRLPAWALLRILAGHNRRRARQRGVAVQDWFLGFMFSGEMDASVVRAGLSRVGEIGGSAEIAFHPGGIADGELRAWEGGRMDGRWYTSAWRERERDFLLDPNTKEILTRFEAGEPPPAPESTRLFRFLVSGATVAAVQLVILYALTEWAGLWYIVSASLAFLVGFVTSFVLQRFWTFADRATSAYGKQLIFYIILNAWNLCLNASGMYALVEHLHLWYMAAQFIMFLVIAIESFVVMQLIIFAPTRSKPENWLEFWNTEQSIYVSRRHRDANYARIAADFLALEPHGGGRTLLDYGCGEALATLRFVEAGFTVALFDPAPLMREKAERFVSEDVKIYDDQSAIPDASADIILIVSVLQYLSKEEFARLLQRLHAFLKPHGTLYVADVVPPDAGMVADIRSLLAAGARNSFLFAALFGLMRTFFSGYRKLRERAGFTTWEEDDLISTFSAAGFAARRLPRNIGFNGARMAFRAELSS